MENKNTVTVRQVRSGIGQTERQVKCLKGLGLGRIGKVRELKDSPCVRGLIAKVAHLVKVEGE